ncbi:MAG: MbnP family protein [Cytophagales bacterium]
MKNTFKFASTIALTVSLLTSCTKKEDQPAPVSTPQTQKVSLNFSHVAGDKTVNFADVFTSTKGAKFTLSMFRYYVSNVRFVKADNTEQTVPGTYFLVSPNNPVCDLGQVPVGDYKGVKFAVGVDSVTNHADITKYPASNPLAVQSPGIHWSWNSGYIFVMVEGTVDTTAGNIDVLTFGQYSKGMFFHLGTDKLYKKVELLQPISVKKEGEKTVSIKTDINTLFANIDLKTQNATHTFSNNSIATLAGANIPSMFSIAQ